MVSNISPWGVNRGNTVDHFDLTVSLAVTNTYCSIYQSINWESIVLPISNLLDSMLVESHQPIGFHRTFALECIQTHCTPYCMCTLYGLVKEQRIFRVK